MLIICIIPARGGSKGVKEKNIAKIAGKPLLAYTIEAAKKSSQIQEIIVSTDSQKIADIATEYGIKDYGKRPSWLATDTALTVDVVKYEIESFEKRNNCQIDAVILLQPTTPLRTAEDISAALETFKRGDSKSLISVYDATHVHPEIMYRKEGSLLTPFLGKSSCRRRQNFEPIYVRNGAIYIASRSLIIDQSSLICDFPAFYLMSRERSINIDEPFDLILTEFLITRHE